MGTMTFTGVAVDVTTEGFFTRPEEWTEEMAPEVAFSAGIDHLTADHWRVIKYMRSRFLDGERPPNLRMISRSCDVSIRQLYGMFPRRPVKLAAKVAGVPEPRAYLGGCGVNWRQARSW